MIQQTVSEAYARQLHEQSVRHQAETKQVGVISGVAGTALGVVLGLVLGVLIRRRKAVGALLLALAPLAGCSTCKDGQKTNVFGGGLLMDSTSYSACNRGCVTKGKRCDCSKQCPCWGEHVKKAP